jgi:hypothetical protein
MEARRGTGMCDLEEKLEVEIKSGSRKWKQRMENQRSGNGNLFVSLN